jgi:hypothetical protein
VGTENLICVGARRNHLPSEPDDRVAAKRSSPLIDRSRPLCHSSFQTAVRLGRQHFRHGVATLRTEKTGVTVTIPILPVPDEILKAGPCAELAFICGENGGPLTKEAFGNVFRDACNSAGVTKSAHGVRKVGATRAANNGATVVELEAIFGWNGIYTRAADRHA